MAKEVKARERKEGGNATWPDVARPIAPSLRFDMATLAEWQGSLAEILPAWRQGLIHHCIGQPWDGVSTYRFDGKPIKVRDVSRLLKRLSDTIAALGDPMMVAPTAGDVRLCVDRVSDESQLVIDFDMGGFVLPVALERRLLSGPRILASMDAVKWVMSMVECDGRKRRTEKTRRELEFAQALEEAVASMGAGCVPMWLRLMPVAYDSINFYSTPYYFCVQTLDDRLDADEHSGDAETPQDLKSKILTIREVHQARRRTLEEITARGSRFAIHPIAAHLIRAGRDEPSALAPLCRHLGRHDPRNCRLALSNGKGVLSFRHGVLSADLAGDGWQYADDLLIVDRTLPDTVLTALAGRLLSDVVDHPAFVTTGIRVQSASFQDGSTVIKPEKLEPEFI